MDKTDLDQLRQLVAEHHAKPRGICDRCLLDPARSRMHLPAGVIFSFCTHHETAGVYEIRSNSWRLYTPMTVEAWDD